MTNAIKNTEISEEVQQINYFIRQGDEFLSTIANELIDLRDFLDLLIDADDARYSQVGRIAYTRASQILYMALRMRGAIADTDAIWYEAGEHHEQKLTLELERITKLFSAVAAVKNFQFHYSFSEQLPERIYTDSILVAQILFIWLDNINHFSSAGDRIEMRVTQEFEDYICIKLTDKAGSLKTEDIEQLFCENRRSSKERVSFGSGLYLSKKMADYLQGRIEITPSIDGLIFCLYIPYQKQ
jgi:signal transduction histidine kinase